MLLLLDWDETISAVDTLAHIAPPSGTQLAGPDLAAYTDAYLADLEAHARSHPPATTVEAQLEHLEALDAVELKSQERIETGGLFRGANAEAIIDRAKDVPLRHGWEAVFAPWLKDHAESIETHVISVGWSAAFIRARLGLPESSLPPNIPLTICANEVEVDPKTGLCTGKLTKSADASPTGTSGIRTGLDKRREMRRIVSRSERERGKAVGPVVYIGDSNTDLPCLLEADVGIVIGENASLRKTLDRLAIPLVGSLADPAPKKQLVEAADWTAVLDILRPLAGPSPSQGSTSSGAA